MSQDVFHLGTFRCCGLIQLPLEEAWEQLDQRPEGRLLVIRRALTFQKCMDLRTYLVLESLRQSRFPDPGFATDEHDLAGPVPGISPTVQQESTLTFTAHQRRKAAGHGHREATGGPPRLQHAIRCRSFSQTT